MLIYVLCILLLLYRIFYAITNVIIPEEIGATDFRFYTYDLRTFAN